MSHSTERSIFLAAIEEKNPTDRAAYLDAVCGTDKILRESVEALLVAHESPAPLLDHPIRPRHSQLAPPFDEPIEQVGMQIGPYKLMEQIGEGGFGLVFVAEQAQPIRRRVALKIVKPGAGSKEVLARFEAERQAVAMMNHPHIAQIFDAGVTADHRPYFVMELVRGLPITQFCDKQQLDVRQRLNLILDVCSAVHHAHRKGIIHRDLKPSNVLVTLHDGKPVAKVIDFGVAKALSAKLSEKTIYTRFFSMIGTPLYMSPEQAEMSGLDIDTRSDIYSLGVLMYEILTGATPFDRNRLDTAGLDEMRRIIREEEPPRPSARLTTSDQPLSTVSDRRCPNRQHLASTLRGDLDWIVMKALEKDRSRRYDTAAALADDIRRHLNGEPVNARPPSALYRFQKLARRNRVAILTATLVGVTLVVGTATSLWQMSLAIDERNAKDAALRDAMAAKTAAIAAKNKVERFAADLIRANELVARAQTEADAGRWREAAEDLDAAVAIQPRYYLPRVQRGQLFNRLRLWPEAAAEYAIALDSGASTSQPQWKGVPFLFLYTGHYDQFARLSSTHADRLNAEMEQPDWLTLRWLLAGADSNSEIDKEMLANIAETWLWRRLWEPPPRRGPPEGPDRGRPPRPRGPDARRDTAPLSVSWYATGFAYLRVNKLDLAIDLLSEANADSRWPASYLVHAPLALAHYAKDEHELARQTLDRSDASIRDELKRIGEQPLQSTDATWFDLVEALQVNREASQTIRGLPSPLDVEIEQYRAVSLNWIESPR